jgi:GNAT superfamily N-acetyltransferase
LYLGQHTDCCQHPKGVGATSAWYGQESPNSGFFVVEDKNGQVVAQSLAWLSDDGAVVFDNIEAKALGDREAKVADVYQKVGDSLAQSHYKVTIGSGESDVNLSRWKTTDAIPLPRDYSAYTDANSQVLLSANAKIKPAPISKLNNWVQGLLPSDKAQAEKIAKVVYPEGWQFTSEGDFGLALKDKNKGTIGYAMIDSENREVTDIAVLPEHRNQSRLLINALFDHIKRVGGDWTADMRESSSYKVLKAYEKWGRVEILEDKVSDNMGSDKMHSVKFRLPEGAK